MRKLRDQWARAKQCNAGVTSASVPLGDGAPELSEARATLAPKRRKGLRNTLSIAFLDLGNIHRYVARVVARPAGVIFERSATASWIVIRWRR
jgi:hypothetical protein